MQPDDGLAALSAPLNRTLGDHVVQRLREAILNGQLKAGQRIVEHEIAAAMQVSRGPVRDAFVQLEREHLIVHQPYKGTIVSGITLRDAEEIYSLRQAIEGLALEYAIKYASDEQIDELSTIVDAMDERARQDYTQEQATDLDLQFHDALYRICGHARVQVAWLALRPQVGLLILSYRLQQPDNFRLWDTEWHRQIANALKSRDLQLGKEIVNGHLAIAYEVVAAAFRQADAIQQNS